MREETERDGKISFVKVTPAAAARNTYQFASGCVVINCNLQKTVVRRSRHLRRPRAGGFRDGMSEYFAEALGIGED